MKHDWNKLGQVGFAPPVEWKPTIIVELDRPMLVLLPGSGVQQFIGIISDEDDEASRWIIAPTSHLELDGLYRGGVSLRAALAKERVLVVDYNDDFAPLRFWEVDSHLLSDDVWPESGALLPSSVREHLATEKVLQPSFDLGGKEWISFGDLSAFTGRIQSLWTAFGEFFNAGFAHLSAEALAPGSLKLNIHTDNLPLFDRIATNYRTLVLASDDDENLKEALASYSPGVSTAFSEYLSAVAQQKIDVLVRWNDEAAYVGHSIARTRQVPQVATMEYPIKHEVLKLTGKFEGYWPDRNTKYQFKFRETETSRVFRGKLDPALSRTQTFAVTAGRASAQLYDVTIIAAEQAGKISYTLLYCEPASRPRGELFS